MRRKEMLVFKKIHLLQVLLLLNLSSATSISKQTPITDCGSTRIQNPFSLQNTKYSSQLNHLLLCKSQKVYLRTSAGLFQISSIDYSSKLLTVSHSFCSSTSHFISPKNLTAGLLLPPQPNSLLLFNCSSQSHFALPFISNFTYNFHGCGGPFTELHPQELSKGSSSSCLIVEDVEKLDPNFHPKRLNCTHYSRVHRKSVDESIHGFELGTQISFDIPDHVPNLCDECKKPNGNCGVGLRCICHPKERKDKVISIGVILNPFGSSVLSFLCFIFVMYIFIRSLARLNFIWDSIGIKIFWFPFCKHL